MKQSKPIKFAIRAAEGILLGLIGFFLYPAISNFITDPVTIAPETLYLQQLSDVQNGPREITKSEFTITNKKDYPIYDVWAKIYPSGGGATTVNVDITPISLNPHKTLNIKKTLVCLDMFKILGIDKNNKRAIWINIYSLKAQQSKNFILNISNLHFSLSSCLL